MDLLELECFPVSQSAYQIEAGRTARKPQSCIWGRFKAVKGGRGGAGGALACVAHAAATAKPVGHLSKTCEGPQTVSEFEVSKLLQMCLVWRPAAEALQVLVARLYI